MNWQLTDLLVPIVLKCVQDSVDNGDQPSLQDCVWGKRGEDLAISKGELNSSTLQDGIDWCSLDDPLLVRMFVFPLIYQYQRIQFSLPAQLAILDLLVSDSYCANWMIGIFGTSLPESQQSVALSIHDPSRAAAIARIETALVRNW